MLSHALLYTFIISSRSKFIQLCSVRTLHSLLQMDNIIHFIFFLLQQSFLVTSFKTIKTIKSLFRFFPRDLISENLCTVVNGERWIAFWSHLSFTMNHTYDVDLSLCSSLLQDCLFSTDMNSHCRCFQKLLLKGINQHQVYRYSFEIIKTKKYNLGKAQKELRWEKKGR